MGNIIKTRLIKIGNSQGIRIPKMLLDQVALTEELELAVQGDHLVLRPTRRPRAGGMHSFARWQLIAMISFSILRAARFRPGTRRSGCGSNALCGLSGQSRPYDWC